MLNTQSIVQIATDRSDLYAFRITEKVNSDDLEAMSELMNTAFDQHQDKVDMLLIFSRYDGAETGAGWSWEAFKSRFKAVTNVNRYVVVGAPEEAKELLEAMGRLIPVKAETYDEEIAAWRSLNAKAIAARS